MVYRSKNNYYINGTRGYYLEVYPRLGSNNEVFLDHNNIQVPKGNISDYTSLSLDTLKKELIAKKSKPVVTETVNKPVETQKVEKPFEKKSNKYKFI